MKYIKNIPLVYGTSLVVMALVVLASYRTLPPEVPLMYSLPIPSAHIVDVWYLLILPISSFILMCFNTLVLKRCVQGESLGMSILYVANMSVILMTTYIFIRIILLVT